MHSSPTPIALSLALVMSALPTVGCSDTRTVALDAALASPMDGSPPEHRDGGPADSADLGTPTSPGDGGAGCPGDECEGYGDSCANPVLLEEGANTFTVDASAIDHLSEVPCTDDGALDDDVVFRYRARTDGLLHYRLDKRGDRWALVIADGTCGELGDPLVCDIRLVPDEMRGELPVRAGESYFFYLTTLHSPFGSDPLPETFSLTLTEDRPGCDDGLEGAVRPILEGASVQSRPTHAIADADADGYLFFANDDSVRRLRKNGGDHERTSVDLRGIGSLFMTGDRLMYVPRDELTVYELSNDGGATHHPEPIAYWSSGRGGRTAVTAHGTDLYGIVSVDGDSSELWAAPAQADSDDLPVSGTILATLPVGLCTAAAADDDALFVVCNNDIVRVDLGSFEVTLVSDHFNYNAGSFNSFSNVLHVWDGDGDGVADALYAYDGGSHAYSVCGWGGTEPAFATQLARWVRAGDGVAWSYGGGLAYDAPNQRLIGFDRSSDTPFVIE